MFPVMKSIRFFLIAALCCLSLPAFSAKDRLVEKSGKTPDWIMSAGGDSFSVFAQSDDMNGARDRCLADIRQYIVNSIASNITSVETSTSASRNDDGNENIYSTYSSELKTAAARLPFLTDISLSNAEEVYWEKYRRKSDGTYYYMYYVLYPFSRMERDRLVREFLAYDREMYGKLTALEERYGTISDVSEIDEGIRELEPLVEYFFDDVRKSEAESLMKTYRSAYSKISLVPESNSLGSFVYSLVLDGRTITCSKFPALRSETAVSLELKPQGQSYELTYDYSLCYPTDDNYVLISYSFPGAKLTYRHQFDVSEDERKVFPVGVVLIDIVQEQDSTFVADVVMTLRSKTDDGFKVGEVSFTLPGVIDFHFPEFLQFDGPGAVYQGHFRQSLDTVPSAGRGMVTGTMKTVVGKRSDTVTFTLPYNVIVN